MIRLRLQMYVRDYDHDCYVWSVAGTRLRVVRRDEGWAAISSDLTTASWLARAGDPAHRSRTALLAILQAHHAADPIPAASSGPAGNTLRRVAAGAHRTACGRFSVCRIAGEWKLKDRDTPGSVYFASLRGCQQFIRRRIWEAGDT